jgi:nucleotide-binding universal stress UspA family protein
MSPAKRILVATDFSDNARPALDYAATLSNALGAALVLAHVYTIPAVPTPDGVFISPVDEPKLRSDLEAALTALKRRAIELGAAPVEIALAEGTPWLELVRLAKERSCDMIVMGTHGRGLVAHFLLGSVAERVVRKAHCPVLTVRSPVPVATPDPIEPSSKTADDAC